MPACADPRGFTDDPRTDEDADWTDEDADWTDDDAGWTDADADWTAEDAGWTAEDAGWTAEDAGRTDGDAGRTDEDAGWTDEDGGVEKANTTTYQAESFTAQSGCAAASNVTGYTGTGFADFGGNGTWIEFNNINAAVAGQYVLRLRYATQGSAARPTAVTVNGASAGTVQFPTTGALTSWVTVEHIVTLRAGNNTVRFAANTTAGGPNLDCVELYGPDLCPSDPNEVDPGQCGCGVPEGTCSKIKMPIEVLGPVGTRETVTFNLTDTTNITHLYLRCNSCGYHVSELDADASKVKATVSVNGGTPINLKRYTGGGSVVGNENIEIIGAEAQYGGMGGVFRTVRMKIPVTGLKTGTNTLVFEHKTPAAPSIGFRILELNLLRNGTNVIPASGFEDDNPLSWAAPRPAATDVEQGRLLWIARDRLVDPGVDAVNGAADGKIAASCADCHASDGRDLKYFNFSNRSIVERSIFHGLTRADGERIASYIRTRSLQHVPAARPWNPPYQPGPGLDAQGAYFWAAGAGLNAILDSDAAMKNELFPGIASPTLAQVKSVSSRLGKLNMRELRVSLPMPEWNQWLPLIHPDDAFNTSAPALLQDYQGTSVSKPYYTALYEAAQASTNSGTLGQMTQRTKAWLKRGMTCQTNGPGAGEPWRGLNGNVLSAIKLPKTTYTSTNCESTKTRAGEEAYELAKRGLSAWIAVKQWEIVHSKNLEDEGKKTFTLGGLSSNNVCSSSCVDARERGWFVEGRNVFDRPPHFTGHNSRHYYGQDIVTGVAETNAWYHLNMVLSSGYRIMMPAHFAYVNSHIEILQAESRVDQGFRFWATMIKQRQLQTNGLYGVETGNDLRTSQPHVYYGANRGGTSDAQASVGTTLWRDFAEAMLEDFVADSSRATRAQWTAASGNSDVQDWDSTDFSTGTRFETGPLQGRNTKRAIPLFRTLGVSSAVLTQLIDWCELTWPNGNWNTVR